jgi:hypothetical protein
MPTTTDDKLARLPKWAQVRIRNLERDLAQAQEIANEMHVDSEDTDTTFGYKHAGHHGKLPNGTTVHFKAGKTQFSVYMRGEGHRGEGEPRLNVNCGDSCAILPGASNDFDVIPRKKNW